MDLQGLLADKRVMYGAVGVGAGAGLYVLYKKTRGSSAPSSSTSSPAGTATLDTTSQNVAQWLGQYSQNLQQQFDDYLRTLTNTIGQQPVQSSPPHAGGQLTLWPVTVPIVHQLPPRPPVMHPLTMGVG